MKARPLLTNRFLPILQDLRLGRFWRAKVLLRFDDPATILPQPWPEVTAADWLKALAHPRRLFSPDRALETAKDGHSSLVVRRQIKLGQALPEVFCKLSHRRNLLRKAIGLLRRSRPSRNWNLAWALLQCQIPTALPLAILEKRIGWIRLAAGIITLTLLPGKPLNSFAGDVAPALPQTAHRCLTKELAHLIRKLHDHHFFHRDLKGRNIFVHLPPSAPARLYLLDLDGCKANGNSYLKKVKSLARLARASLDWPTVRKTTRLRFLRHYFNTPRQFRQNYKTFWRDIDRQLRRKLTPQDPP